MYRKLILLVLTATAFGFATNNLRFDKLTTRDGLNQSSVTAIIQDNEGYMWFGTQNGLNRYDGYKFKYYKNVVNDKNTNATNFITAIAEDSKNNLWIGTSHSGISVYNKKQNGFYPIQLKSNQLHISTILVDHKGFIWVGTENGGLLKFNSNRALIAEYSTQTSLEITLNSNRITALFEDKDKNLWIGYKNAGLNRLGPERKTNRYFANAPHNFNTTSLNQTEDGLIWIGTSNDGVFIFNPESGIQTQLLHKPGDPYSLAENTINKILKDRNGHFWLATYNGISIYKPQKNKFYNYQHNPGNPFSLGSNHIITFLEDRSGNMWIGSFNNGISRYTPSIMSFDNYYQNETAPSSILGAGVWSFLVEDDETIWVGTDKGLNKWNPQTGSFIHFKPNPLAHSINNSIIRSIARLDNTHLLLGTDGGGINIFNTQTGYCTYLKSDPNRNSVSSNKIRNILPDNDGTFWVATLDGLNHYNPKTGKFKVIKYEEGNPNSLNDSRILEVVKDHTNTLWLATYNGLSSYNIATGAITNYLHAPLDSTSISNNDILDIVICEKNKDVLWIGTNVGLNKLDLKTRKFKRFKNESHTASNIIYTIVHDGDKHLWLGTTKGISRLNPANNSYETFGDDSGILNTEYNAGCAVKLKSGRTLMGGINGITAFNPKNYKRDNSVVPVVITAFKKENKYFPIDSILASNHTLVIDEKDKHFSFEFASLDYTNSEKNHYRYLLEGYNEKWINTGTRNYTDLTNLDPGEYTFRVMGTNSSGIWNDEGASLKIYVKPAFWNTIWFRLILSVTLFLAVYGYLVLRWRRMQKQSKILQQKVEARTLELNNKNALLNRSQQDTDSILQNVSQGLFILNKEHIIQNKHSHALLEILEIEEASGLNLIELLKTCVPESDAHLTLEYLELLFDSSLDEELIIELNPLNNMEFNLKATELSIPKTKYLTFRFKRILDKGEISNLIVTVIDKTERHLLEIQLKESQATAKKKIEWVMGILHLDPKTLHEFIKSTELELRSIDSKLKTECLPSENPQKLVDVARSLHLLKGNATLLDLEFFTQQVHNLEDVVVELQSHEMIDGGDFLPIVIQINEIQNNIDDLKELIEKFSNFSKSGEKNSERHYHSLVKSIENMIHTLSDDLKKDVNLDYSGFHSNIIPTQYNLLTKNIFVQLARNSMVHGIEDEEERVKQNKTPYGNIYISNEIADNAFKIKFKDDGRGLQLSRLREKAISSNNWSEEEIDTWDESALANLIFEPGISSTTSTDLYAGRGIGMDLVHDQIKKYNGKIEVNFTESEYCEFIITLPTGTLN